VTDEVVLRRVRSGPLRRGACCFSHNPFESTHRRVSVRARLGAGDANVLIPLIAAVIANPARLMHSKGHGCRNRDRRAADNAPKHKREPSKGVAMSQLERAIGKLVMDEAFRAKFGADPVRASLGAGLRLSPTEIAALAWIPARAFEELARSLDDGLRWDLWSES